MVQSQIKISIAIMAHPSRAEAASILLKRVHTQGFYTSSVVYDNGGGEWNTGERALRSHTDSDYHVLIQDDGIIGTSFYQNVVNAIQNIPTGTPISFYCGTVRPFPNKIRRAVETAESITASYLSGDRLYWGVCFALPTSHIRPMLDYVRHSTLPFDQRISLYYNKYKMAVYYTYPSIADHNYKLGSLIGNDYNPEPRKAHRFEPREVMKWNERIVEI